MSKVKPLREQAIRQFGKYPPEHIRTTMTLSKVEKSRLLYYAIKDHQFDKALMLLDEGTIPPNPKNDPRSVLTMFLILFQPSSEYELQNRLVNFLIDYWHLRDPERMATFLISVSRHNQSRTVKLFTHLREVFEDVFDIQFIVRMFSFIPADGSLLLAIFNTEASDLEAVKNIFDALLEEQMDNDIRNAIMDTIVSSLQKHEGYEIFVHLFELEAEEDNLIHSDLFTWLDENRDMIPNILLEMANTEHQGLFDLTLDIFLGRHRDISYYDIMKNFFDYPETNELKAIHLIENALARKHIRELPKFIKLLDPNIVDTVLDYIYNQLQQKGSIKLLQQIEQSLELCRPRCDKSYNKIKSLSSLKQTVQARERRSHSLTGRLYNIMFKN